MDINYVLTVVLKDKKNEKNVKIRKPRKSPEDKLKEQEEKFQRKMQKTPK